MWHICPEKGTAGQRLGSCPCLSGCASLPDCQLLLMITVCPSNPPCTLAHLEKSTTCASQGSPLATETCATMAKVRCDACISLHSDLPAYAYGRATICLRCCVRCCTLKSRQSREQSRSPAAGSGSRRQSTQADLTAPLSVTPSYPFCRTAAERWHCSQPVCNAVEGPWHGAAAVGQLGSCILEAAQAPPPAGAASRVGVQLGCQVGRQTQLCYVTHPKIGGHGWQGAQAPGGVQLFRDCQASRPGEAACSRGPSLLHYTARIILYLECGPPNTRRSPDIHPLLPAAEVHALSHYTARSIL